MFDRENNENCSSCHKEFTKDRGSGIVPSVPICDLCPRIDELEMEVDDTAFDIATASGLARDALFGRLMALQLRLSELKIARSVRL